MLYALVIIFSVIIILVPALLGFLFDRWLGAVIGAAFGLMFGAIALIIAWLWASLVHVQ